MEKKLFVGLISALLFLIAISPVAAYERQGNVIVSMTCDSPICPDSEFTCTVSADYSAAPGVEESVGILLFTMGGEITEASDGGIIINQGEAGNAGWILGNMQKGDLKTRTIKMKSLGIENYLGNKNVLYAFGKAYAPKDIQDYNDPNWEFIEPAQEDLRELVVSDSCTIAPEFPSVFLPATFIIGFLGAVLLIQRTREP